MPDPVNDSTPLTPTNSTPQTPITPEAPTTPSPIDTTPEVTTPEITPPGQAQGEAITPTPIPLSGTPIALQTQENPAPAGLSSLLQKAKEKIQFRKRAKLEKIMAAASASSQGKITNNDVQKLLRCSDATATRYLSELVKQGRLRRVGPANNAFYQI